MKRSNFLIFMTDHQRGDTVPPFIRAITPNLEEMYSESVSFTRTFCPSPHCCPSRASFFSGLYPSEHGVWNNVDVGNALSRGLFDGVRLWSEDLKAAGYGMYFSGKWHVSAEEGPCDRGFESLDNNSRLYSKTKNVPSTYEWDVFYKGKDINAGTEIRTESEIIRPGYPKYLQYGETDNPFNDTGTVGAAEVRLAALPDDKPWCLYVGTLGPHDPYFVPKQFLDMYNINDIKLPDNFYDDLSDKPYLYKRTQARYSQLSENEHRESIRHFLAFCTYEDYLFGRLMDTLKKRSDMDNTIVIYMSDHGDYMGEHGLWAKGLPCFRSAYYIPLLFKWPGQIKDPGRSVDSLVSMTDLAPTILEMAGVKAGQAFSGKSLVPFLHGEKTEDWRQEIHTQSNGNEIYGIQRSVMTDEWKYVYNSFDCDELYNLKNDPLELHNLIFEEAGMEKHMKTVEEMCRKMWRFAHEHQDTCVNPYIMTALAPFGPGIIYTD